MLVRALEKESGVGSVSIICCASGIDRSSRFARRATDAAHYRLAGVGRELVPLAALAGSERVTVHKISPESAAAAPQNGFADLVIDFTRAPHSFDLQPPPGGVLELWIANRRGDLGYSIGLPRAAPTEREQRLTVTLRSAEGTRKTLESSSPPAISPFPAINRRNEMSRSVSLLIRAVRRAVAGKLEGSPEWNGSGGSATRGGNPTAVLPVAVRAIVRRVRRLCLGGEKWAIAFRTGRASFVRNTPSAKPGGFQVVRTDDGRFLADPCAFSHDGTTYLFFEDMVEEHGKGVISYSTLEPDGCLSAPREALRQPFHLSYPFVFEHEGAVYMVPESSQNGTVDLYVAKRFPDQWEHHACLLRGLNATDATLYHDGARWWMFAAVGENGAAAWDELFLFTSLKLQGPWSAHPRNPVKQDARSSRPAGRLFWRGEQLIRPAQDCSRVYGGAIKLCAVERLALDAFSERPLETIPPDWIAGAEALHTLSSTAELEAIDVRF